MASLLDECVSLLKKNKNLVLTGAPGSGKTHLAFRIAAKLVSGQAGQANDLDERWLPLILKEGICVPSSKKKKSYHITEVKGNEVRVYGESKGSRPATKTYEVSFSQIIKAYRERLWEGGQKNGLDPYAAALALYVFNHPINQSKDSIQFVQFHPSYDYTDFVEGLRPVCSGEDGKVGFELRDGVFKSFCKRALKELGSGSADNFDQCWDQLISELSEADYIDIPLLSGKRQFRIELNVNGDGLANRMYENGEYEKGAWVQGQSKFFSKEQLYNVYKGYRGIPSGGHDNYRKAIIAYMISHYQLEPFDAEKVSQAEAKSTAHVFIIDEINRGELSKIFGELFFCIDPGYRGERGRVQTQYQNLITDQSDPFYAGFYVPENVYIIGTMNDIDRSVESLDFAIRRRFAWKEVKADELVEEMLNDLGNVKSRAASKMRSLNRAIWDELSKTGIEGLNAAYHMGAAYFRKLSDYLDKDGNNFEEACAILWEHHLKGVLFEYLRGSPQAEENLAKLKEAFDQEARENAQMEGQHQQSVGG